MCFLGPKASLHYSLIRRGVNSHLDNPRVPITYELSLNEMWKLCLILAGFFALATSVRADEARVDAPRVNKLQYMYQFFYLPFSVDFREGRTLNDILPYIKTSETEPPRLLKPQELQTLDKEWATLREPWKKKSLLISTQVPLGTSQVITQKLISHHIGLSRGAFDTLTIPERIQVAEMLKKKPADVQAAFKQLRFLKSFLTPIQEERFNFFIFSPSWCESSREYRVLLEAYLKNFPNLGFNLHSVVIEDSKEEIFDSKIIKELFPHAKKYSHDSVPRFLAIENVQGNMLIWEEGEALKELYDRYFLPHRGFLNSRSKLFDKAPVRDTASD